jgi:hypothetical protein
LHDPVSGQDWLADRAVHGPPGRATITTVLPGDWLFLAMATFISVLLVIGFSRERRQQITGVRSDISPRRVKLGLGVTVTVSVAFLVGAILGLVDDGTFTPTSGRLRGVKVHVRVLGGLSGIFALTCAYMASRFVAELRSRTRPERLPSARYSTGRAGTSLDALSVAEARARWLAIRSSRPEGEWHELSAAARQLVAAAWGIDTRTATSTEIQQRLMTLGLTQMAEVAGRLLTQLDQARYGGSRFAGSDIDKQFRSLDALVSKDPD